MWSDPYEKFVTLPVRRTAAPAASVVPRTRVRPEPPKPSLKPSLKPDLVERYRLVAASGWPNERPTIRTLAHAVSKRSGIGVTDILGTSRRSDAVKARHILTWLARRFIRSSAPIIATALRRRDHTAVLYSIARVNLAIREARIPSPCSETPEDWAGVLWNADWPALGRHDPRRPR